MDGMVDEADEVLLDVDDPETLPLPNLGAGCVWDPNNFSCSFDAVFMVFYSMYGQSDQTWRDAWRAESPEWNVPLGNLFDLLLSTTINNSPPQERSLWFSRCRDVFRSQVTKSNPTLFPHGRRFAPAGGILQRILGGTSAEPLAYQNLICSGCGVERNNIRFSLSYLSLPFNLKGLHNHQDPTILPLQVALTRYLNKHSREPNSVHKACHICQARWDIHSFHVVETSWIWFELNGHEQSILPSLELGHHPPAMQSMYTLQAIIYLGGGHFTARMRNGPNMWWGHDGQWRFGIPRAEVIVDEEELRHFHGRVPAFLIYRRGDAGG